jgi:hypothetical protein
MSETVVPKVVGPQGGPTDATLMTTATAPVVGAVSGDNERLPAQVTGTGVLIRNRLWALVDKGIVLLMRETTHPTLHPFDEDQMDSKYARAVDVSNTQCQVGYLADEKGNVTPPGVRMTALPPGQPAYHDTHVGAPPSSMESAVQFGLGGASNSLENDDGLGMGGSQIHGEDDDESKDQLTPGMRGQSTPGGTVPLKETVVSDHHLSMASPGYDPARDPDGMTTKGEMGDSKSEEREIVENRDLAQKKAAEDEAKRNAAQEKADKEMAAAKEKLSTPPPPPPLSMPGTSPPPPPPPITAPTE